MFVCKACHSKTCKKCLCVKGLSLKSYGRCEVCEKTRECYDCHCRC